MLPFEEESIDAILCVGASINYTDPILVLNEFHRVLGRGGVALIDFESSGSAEVRLKDRNKSVSVIERSFAGRHDKQYVFSEKFILNSLRSIGFSIVKSVRYHTSSSIWASAFGDNAVPSFVYKMDKFVSQTPLIRSFSSNIVVTIQKGAEIYP